MNIGETLKNWKEWLALALFFTGMLAVPVRLFAEDFIQKTVTNDLAALEASIAELQEKLEDAPSAEQLEDLTALIKQQMALIQFLVGQERAARP